MALVRRTVVEGRQAAPTATGLTVPRQPSAADIDDATATPPAAAEEMAAAPDRPVRLWAVLLALVLVAAGGAAAFAIDHRYAVATMPIQGAVAALVVVVLFAAVVERLLEPFTRWLPGRRARNHYERQIADLANRHPDVTLTTVATAKARLGQHRADQVLLTWGLATAAATMLAAVGGVHIMRAIVAGDADGWDATPVWIDSLVTGLIVGSATKPVHDLLTRMQQTNARRRDPTEG